jgi:hypothetical protein
VHVGELEADEPDVLLPPALQDLLHVGHRSAPLDAAPANAPAPGRAVPGVLGYTVAERWLATHRLWRRWGAREGRGRRGGTVPSAVG